MERIHVLHQNVQAFHVSFHDGGILDTGVFDWSVVGDCTVNNPLITISLREERDDGWCRFDIWSDFEFNMTRNWSRDQQWIPPNTIGVALEISL
jgi:hypothetical protein